jgi:hypothetical protein
VHFPLPGFHLKFHCEVWAQDSNYSVLMEIFKSVHCSRHKRAKVLLYNKNVTVGCVVCLEFQLLEKYDSTLEEAVLIDSSLY